MLKKNNYFAFVNGQNTNVEFVGQVIGNNMIRFTDCHYNKRIAKIKEYCLKNNIDFNTCYIWLENFKGTRYVMYMYSNFGSGINKGYFFSCTYFHVLNEIDNLYPKIA